MTVRELCTRACVCELYVRCLDMVCEEKVITESCASAQRTVPADERRTC